MWSPPVAVLVAGDAADGGAVGGEGAGTLPGAGLAVQRPEVEAVGLGGDRRGDADDRLEVAVLAVAAEVALDESDAARCRAKLAR
jgi:hypothetical protein